MSEYIATVITIHLFAVIYVAYKVRKADKLKEKKNG
tara:strand:+ start:330 stop:437 length:108 start_codon:yes stop_codon:yes gene_type:complete